MPRVFGRGSRSQPAALVSERDDAALFPAIRILTRYGSAKSGRARRVRAGSLGKQARFLFAPMRTSDRHDLLRRRSFGICRQAKWGMTSKAKSTRVSTPFRSPWISRSMPALRYCRIRSICWMPDLQTKFVAANGLRFEVLEQGTGVRLALCLHGFPEHAISWRHQIPVLAGMGYRVWAVNQRGYGRTTRPTQVADY